MPLGPIATTGLLTSALVFAPVPQTPVEEPAAAAEGSVGPAPTSESTSAEGAPATAEPLRPAEVSNTELGLEDTAASTDSSPTIPDSSDPSPIEDGVGFEPEPDEEDWEDEDDIGGDADDYDPLRDSPEALRVRRRIAGGAVLVGLGALTSLGALAMGLSDRCAQAAGNSCSEDSRNRAALTMGVPGIAVLVTGIVVLDLGVRERTRMRMGVHASSTSAGLTLGGRF